MDYRPTTGRQEESKMGSSDSEDCLQSWRIVEEGTKKCDEHGDYESQLMKHTHPRNPAWWTRCPQCNLVYEREMTELEARLLLDPGEAERLAIMRRDAAEIPKRYWAADVWQWEEVYPAMEVVARVVKDYCGSFELVLDKGQGLIFTGNPGTGKTHVACAIANHVMSKEGTALYSTASDFLIRVRNTYNNDASETERQVYEAFESPDLLIIDEIGRNQETEHSIATMFNMIDRRYRSLKPTILVTNLDKEQTVKLLGKALVSRFRDGGGKMLGFVWPDLRTNEKEIES